MNDDQLLTAVRSTLTGVKDSLTDVHLDRPVSVITGQARARRLRRGLYGGAAAAVAAGAGLSVALTTSSAPSHSVHVSLDAWSVSTTRAGKVELTIRELKDRARLERTLADAGVPAVVRFGGQFCWAPNPADDLTSTSGKHFLGRAVLGHGAVVALTIDPAALPADAKVSIGVEDMGTGDGLFADEVVKDGAPLTCQHLLYEPTIRPAPGR
jgi:hypothetical protein